MSEEDENLKEELIKEHDVLDVCFFRAKNKVLFFDKDYDVYNQIEVRLHEFKDGRKAFYLRIETMTPTSGVVYDIIPISQEHAKKILNFFWDYFTESD